MRISVTDPSGRVWLISRRHFRRPRPRRRVNSLPRPGLDLANGLDFADGFAGLVASIAIIVAILAITEFWPIVIFVIELAVVGAVACVHALLGRRVVVAESDGDVVSWTVKGQRASVRLAAQVARAARDGTPFPPGGRDATGDEA